jgi:Uma2 family endonuclease
MASSSEVWRKVNVVANLNRLRDRRKVGRMTTGEYLHTSETVLPSELAHGVLRVAEAPSVSHQRMVGELFLALSAFIRAGRLGEVLLAPTDVILDFDGAVVVQPDLLFLSPERTHLATDCVHGAPDLVIEVLSPNARVGNIDEKVGWFAQYGVRECWLVSLPHRQVSILTLNAGGVVRKTSHRFGEIVASGVLPGFRSPALP